MQTNKFKQFELLKMLHLYVTLRLLILIYYFHDFMRFYGLLKCIHCNTQ